MNISKRWRLWCCVAIGIILWVAGLCKAGGRLTYIERSRINEESVQSIAVTDHETVLEQEFTMPYELFWGAEIKTGTFGRNNNSFWKVELKEAESNKTVYEWECNASQISDGEYYKFNVKNPVRVKLGQKYKITVCSEDATGNSALAFYASGTDVYEGGSLFLDGRQQEADLCMRITGGEKDVFWSGLYLAVTLLLLATAVWCVCMKRKGKPVRTVVEAVGTACIYLFFMYIFSRSNMGTFTDECDNIQGGMLIAKGSVLYRDYYTQHTPFGYYLCGIFAFLGAGNIQQFRLLYYLLMSAVWGGLYYRHSAYFGRARMLLLPLVQLWITMSMFYQASKIMGDNIQGICMVALAMEFMRYWEDEELGKSRCLIVAACIFLSVASAFVSVFALAPIVVGVLIKEVLIWKRNGGFGLNRCVGRYSCLVGATAIPFAVTLLYFICNHAMGQMYRMAYQFNTMVYNRYQDNQYGRVKWKPFFLGIRNYFEIISSNFNSVITAAGNDMAVIQLVIAVSAVAALLFWSAKMNKGEGVIASLALFLCMCGNGTRSGMDFHAVALWDLAIAVIFLTDAYGNGYGKWKEKRAVLLAVAAMGCYFLQPYVTMVADHIVYHPEIVEGVEEEVVAMTVPGEKIFIDAYKYDFIYLLYKERYPVNRNCYLLPWYMDWFEQDTIDDLEAGMPNILVYQPETDNYPPAESCPLLDQAIRTHYESIKEGAPIWKLRVQP